MHVGVRVSRAGEDCGMDKYLEIVEGYTWVEHGLARNGNEEAV